MKRTVAFTAVAATMALMGQMAAPALADDDRKLEAVPFEFVGKAGDCGAAAGSRIVTAAWLKGTGLPDTDDPNTTNNTASASTQWVPPPSDVDLAVAKTAPATGALGEVITYDITVTKN